MAYEDRRLPVDGAEGVRGVVALRDADRSDLLYPYGAGYYEEPDNESFDFWSLINILLSRKWMILAIVLVGVASSLVLTLRVVPLYSATASMEILKEEVQIIEGTGVGPATIADATYMETQYRLIRSRFLAERVAEDLNLANDPRYASRSFPRETRLLQASQRVLGGIRVAPAGNSRLVNVSYISPYPNEAARIANAVVDAFIQTNLERKYNTTSFAREFLEDRLVASKRALEESERKLVQYAEDQNLLDFGGGAATLDESSIISLNNELSQAESARIEAEQVYRSSVNSSFAADRLNSANLSRLNEIRSSLQTDYQELSGRFKPDYPDMVRLQVRIEAIEAEISDERAAILGGLRSDFDAALAREQSLRTRVSELREGLQDERNRRIQYRILQREVETLRAQYEALLQRSKEVSIASAVGSSNVSIVDAALVPGRPFQPNFNRSLLQGLILSLGFGVGLAFVLNFIDDTIKTPEDVREKLGLATIGVIPKLKGKSDIVSDLSEPKSVVSEAFASAQTALEFATDQGAPRSILITGTRPGEGKTSTTIALATVFARAGKRVLIIDGDMRKPSFVVDTSKSIGLSGLLTGRAELSAQVVRSKTDGMWVLPSGVIPPNPAQLLSGPRLREIIDDAEKEFDLVILDSPPVMSFTDSPRLGSVVSGALVVIQSGRIRTPAIRRTVSQLYDSRTDVLGVMLTKFDVKAQGHDYGYYYGSYQSNSYAYVERNSRNDKKRSILIEAAEDEPKGNEKEKWSYQDGG